MSIATLLLSIMLSQDYESHDCAMPFINTGESSNIGTLNRKLRVYFLNKGCIGSPVFYTEGGLGYGIIYNPGQVGPMVFEVHLVASQPGIYHVFATDAIGQGQQHLYVEIP